MLNALRFQCLMSRHIKNPQAIQTLDKQQQKRLAGVLFSLFGLYPLYLAMRLVGLKGLYFRIHRHLYMVARYGENQF